MPLNPNQIRVRVLEDGQGTTDEQELLTQIQQDADDTRKLALARSTDPAPDRTLSDSTVIAQGVQQMHEEVMEAADRADALAASAPYRTAFETDDDLALMRADGNPLSGITMQTVAGGLRITNTSSITISYLLDAKRAVAETGRTVARLEVSHERTSRDLQIGFAVGEGSERVILLWRENGTVYHVAEGGTTELQSSSSLWNWAGGARVAVELEIDAANPAQSAFVVEMPSGRRRSFIVDLAAALASAPTPLCIALRAGDSATLSLWETSAAAGQVERALQTPAAQLYEDPLLRDLSLVNHTAGSGGVTSLGTYVDAATGASQGTLRLQMSTAGSYERGIIRSLAALGLKEGDTLRLSYVVRSAITASGTIQSRFAWLDASGNVIPDAVSEQRVDIQGYAAGTVVEHAGQVPAGAVSVRWRLMLVSASAGAVAEIRSLSMTTRPTPGLVQYPSIGRVRALAAEAAAPALAATATLQAGLSAVEGDVAALQAALGGGRTPRLLVRPPAGFGGFAGALAGVLAVYRRGMAYEADVDLSSRLVLGTAYYVDPVAGSDSNAGTSPAAALRSVDRAIELANAGGVPVEIHLVPGWYHYEQGTKGRLLGVGATLRCEGGVAYLTMAVPVTWVLQSGTVYRATVAAGTPASVVDRSDLDEQGIPRALQAVGSVATCQATPGSYHISGSTVYVHAADSRNLAISSAVEVVIAGDNLRLGGVACYLEGVALVGGDECIASSAACDLTLVRSGITHSTTGNGFTINHAGASVVAVESIAAYTAMDGFNYRGGANGIEVRCLIYQTGLADGTGGSNCSTQHHGGWTARVGGQYVASLNRCVHDIGAGGSWNVACAAGQARSTGTNSYSWLCGDTPTSSNTTMWLEGCTDLGGSRHSYGVRSGSQMYVRATPVWGREDLDVAGTLESY